MVNINNPQRSDYLQRNKHNLEKKQNSLNKYEEVICKSILAYEVFFKNFFLDDSSWDLRTIVNNLYEQEGFQGYDVFAKLIISAMYDNKGQGETDFLPTHIEKEVDPNVEKKFLISAEL